jgi:hypothetical protein
LLAAGFAFDMAVLEIEDEEVRDRAKPYVLAGQRFSYSDAIDVLKMERMFFKLPAYERGWEVAREGVEES